jgi:hypothetical protein
MLNAETVRIHFGIRHSALPVGYASFTNLLARL